MAELTQEFKILPSNEHIRSILEDDAKKIVLEIQEEVLENIEKRKGIVTVTRTIPELYFDSVVKMLKMWVKIHGYKLRVKGCDFTVYSPVAKRLIKNSGSESKHTVGCWRCGRSVKFYVAAIIALFGGILSSHSVVLFTILMIEHYGTTWTICTLGLLSWVGAFFTLAGAEAGPRLYRILR